MAIWRVTEQSQPYIGQWDATTDSFWDGDKWVPNSKWLAWTYVPTTGALPNTAPTTTTFGIGSAGFGTPGNGYYGHGGSNQAGVVTSGVDSLNYKFDKAIYDALVKSHAISESQETKVEPKKPDVWAALQSMF